MSVRALHQIRFTVGEACTSLGVSALAATATPHKPRTLPVLGCGPNKGLRSTVFVAYTIVVVQSAVIAAVELYSITRGGTQPHNTSNASSFHFMLPRFRFKVHTILHITYRPALLLVVAAWVAACVVLEFPCI